MITLIIHTHSCSENEVSRVRKYEMMSWVALCNLVTVFAETKSVTKSSLHYTHFLCNWVLVKNVTKVPLHGFWNHKCTFASKMRNWKKNHSCKSFYLQTIETRRVNWLLFIIFSCVFDQEHRHSTGNCFTIKLNNWSIIFQWRCSGTFSQNFKTFFLILFQCTMLWNTNQEKLVNV